MEARCLRRPTCACCDTWIRAQNQLTGSIPSDLDALLDPTSSSSSSSSSTIDVRKNQLRSAIPTTDLARFDLVCSARDPFWWTTRLMRFLPGSVKGRNGCCATIATVDQYQGQQNDIVLLSIVRTKPAGRLWDRCPSARRGGYARTLGIIRRLSHIIVWICGFDSLQETMHPFAERPDQLQLVMGEVHPATRKVADEAQDVFTVEDVAHMGSRNGVTPNKSGSLLASIYTGSVSGDGPFDHSFTLGRHKRKRFFRRRQRSDRCATGKILQ